MLFEANDKQSKHNFITHNENIFGPNVTIKEKHVYNYIHFFKIECFIQMSLTFCNNNVLSFFNVTSYVGLILSCQVTCKINMGYYFRYYFRNYYNDFLLGIKMLESEKRFKYCSTSVILLCSIWSYL